MSWPEVAVQLVHAAQAVVLAALAVWAQQTRRSTAATQEQLEALSEELGGPQPPSSSENG